MADPVGPTFRPGDLVTWDSLFPGQHGIVRRVLRLGTVWAQLADLDNRPLPEASVVEFVKRTKGGEYPRCLRPLRSDELARLEWRRAWKNLPLVWHGSDLETPTPALRVNNVVQIRTQAEFDDLARQLAEGWRLLQERPR